MMNKIKQVLEEKGVKQTWLADKLGKWDKIYTKNGHNRKYSESGHADITI